MGMVFETVHRRYLKQNNTKQENSVDVKEGKGEHHNTDT
jgi:hypothetical protein